MHIASTFGVTKQSQSDAFSVPFIHAHRHTLAFSTTKVLRKKKIVSNNFLPVSKKMVYVYCIQKFYVMNYVKKTSFWYLHKYMYIF